MEIQTKCHGLIVCSLCIIALIIQLLLINLAIKWIYYAAYLILGGQSQVEDIAEMYTEYTEVFKRKYSDFFQKYHQETAGNNFC
jgi:hypothetical protein